MRCSLTRRQVIKVFCLSMPAALLASNAFGRSEDDHLCVHVYSPNGSIPEPLLQHHEKKESHSPEKEYFQSGLPEFMLCTSEVKFVDLFQYFWPISQEEFRHMREAIEVKFAKPELSDRGMEEFSIFLDRHGGLSIPQGMTSAIVLTLNDHTVQYVSEVVQIARHKNIAELVIFKDPSKPPYLCSFPAEQKGFRRPPPIGSNRP